MMGHNVYRKMVVFTMRTNIRCITMANTSIKLKALTITYVVC